MKKVVFGLGASLVLAINSLLVAPVIGEGCCGQNSETNQETTAQKTKCGAARPLTEEEKQELEKKQTLRRNLLEFEEKEAEAPVEIKSLSVESEVLENRVIKMKETYTVLFNKMQKEFTVKIPLVSQTEEGTRMRVRHLKVNEQFQKQRMGDVMVVKIGGREAELTGEKNYVLEYDYDLGADRQKQMDKLVFDLVNDKRILEVSDVNFKLSLPKKFEREKAEIMIGTRSNWRGEKRVELDVNNDEVTEWKNGDSYVQWRLDHDVMFGHVYGTLAPEQILRASIELPDGYFNRQALGDWGRIIIVVIVLLLLIVAAVLAKKRWQCIKSKKKSK